MPREITETERAYANELLIRARRAMCLIENYDQAKIDRLARLDLAELALETADPRSRHEVVAGIIILTTGWTPADPLLSIGIAALIAGVIGDVHTRGLDRSPAPLIVVPLRQYGVASLRIAARAHYDLLRVFPFTQDSGKVARPGVTDSHRCIPLQQKCSHRFAYDVASTDHDRSRPVDCHSRRFDEAHDAGRRAWHECRAAQMKTADVDGMEAVDVFRRIDCIDDLSGVDLPRQRKLHEDSVDFIVCIQAMDLRQKVGLPHRRVEHELGSAKAKLVGVLCFVPNVDFRGRIASHTDGNECWPIRKRRQRLPDFALHLLGNRFSEQFSDSVLVLGMKMLGKGLSERERRQGGLVRFGAAGLAHHAARRVQLEGERRGDALEPRSLAALLLCHFSCGSSFWVDRRRSGHVRR